MQCSVSSYFRTRTKVLLRFLGFVLILIAGILLHGRVGAPIAVAETTTTQAPSQTRFTSGNATIDGYIIDAGLKYGVDPLLVFYVIRQESRFKPSACSNKNAQGLMQLIPATAARFKIDDAYDPEQNIDGGVHYLRWLLERFEGDVSLALAGYNAGEGAVEKCGNRVPEFKETKDYVEKIVSAYGKSFHALVSPEQAPKIFGFATAIAE